MSNSSKTKIDAFLVKKLNLENPPVGISLLKSAPPESIEGPDGQYTFCEVVDESRKKSRVIGITKTDLIRSVRAHEVTGRNSNIRLVSQIVNYLFNVAPIIDSHTRSSRSGTFSSL